MDHLDLERTVLGTVLAFGAPALDCIPDLTTDDFSAPVHREIFAACARLQADGLPVDFPTVAAELAGNKPALAVLDGPPWDNLATLEGHAAEMRRLATIRAVVRQAQEIVAIGRGLAGGASATLSKLERCISRLTAVAAARDASVVSIGQIAADYLALVDRVGAGEPPPERVGTGLDDLDRLIGGGFEAGALAVVAGTTSSGKSSLAGQIATYAASRTPAVPVAFITSEMTHVQMLARLVAAECGVPVATILSPRESAAHRDEIRQIGRLPIWFQRVFPPNLDQTQATIRYLVRHQGARLAVIDYVQRLVSLDDDSQERETARVIAAAKNLALELGIVVVACAQVNRQSATRKDIRPKLSDLRGSGRLEQEGDYVLFVHRPELYGKKDPPMIIVAKNRNGPRGRVEVRWEGDACRFAAAEE